ncbi:MAG: TIGR03032 family protein [Pseudolabrys sp.]|nr:TIGR03032 family protein [Pseudolabrys sp.]
MAVSSRVYPFASFQQISQASASRPLVLFGAGNIAAKTARRLGSTYSYIVDNNAAMWGLTELGVEVRNPDMLSERLDPKPFFIICTTSFTEVGPQLEKCGYLPNVDFVISPILNDLRIIAEMEACKATLLFTSGSPPTDDPFSGGGVYQLDVDGGFEYSKKHSGNCHGLIAFGESYISVDDEIGLVEFDRNMKVLRSAKLPVGARGHGVTYSEETKSFYVVASYMDKILIFDADFKPTGEIGISNKYKRDSVAHHHCNDIVTLGNSLYVSMFSQSGNWKQDVFDGAVVEYEIPSGRMLGPVVSGLWMPHNIDLFDGGLVVLDSLRGNLLRNNMNVSGSFPGFTRGLAYNGQYFFIGQSRNRNYSKNIGLSKNISIDAAIVVFDDTTKVSRSLQLPNKVSEVHAILSV